MHKKHIFVGGGDDIFLVYGNMQGKKPVKWHVPESSEVGDQGFFLLPQEIGFCALGEVISDKIRDDNQHTGWSADVRIVYQFQPNVALKLIQQKFPDWTQIQHPPIWYRSVTIDLASHLEDYLSFYDYIRYEQDDRGAALNKIIR